MSRLPQIWAASLLLLFSSCVYYTYLVVQVGSMNPYAIQAEMTDNLGSFGIWAFALDFIFILFLGSIVRKKLKKKRLQTNHLRIFGI